jgi:lysophospholipase L1-like esterase
LFLRGGLLVAGIGLSAVVLAWFHVLPGGWFLRNLIEDPGLRAERLRLEHRRLRLEAFAEQAPPRDAVVLLGSSTMESCPAEVLFPNGPVVNRGIGAERASELRARLGASVPGSAAGAVIYTGAFDFHTLHRDPASIAQDVAAVVRDLRAMRPDLPLLVLGILPSRRLTPERRAALGALNRHLESMASAQGTLVTFLPADRPPLRLPDGRLDPGLSRDAWHLNEDGYAVLGRWMIAHGGPVGALLEGRPSFK